MRGATQIVQRDVISGQTRRYDFGTDIVVEEPLFIPSSERSEEGEGWLVHTALNKREAATELHVFGRAAPGRRTGDQLAPALCLPAGLPWLLA